MKIRQHMTRDVNIKLEKKEIVMNAKPIKVKNRAKTRNTRKENIKKRKCEAIKNGLNKKRLRLNHKHRARTSLLDTENVIPKSGRKIGIY